MKRHTVALIRVCSLGVSLFGSVCICVEKETTHNFGGKRSCTFETITMAPIQTKVRGYIVGCRLVLFKSVLRVRDVVYV